MLLLGMGGRTAYDVVDILEKGRQPVAGCVVELEAEPAPGFSPPFGCATLSRASVSIRRKWNWRCRCSASRTGAAPSPACPPSYTDREREMPENKQQSNNLLNSPLHVINVGLEEFAQNLKDRGVSVVHVDWSPPAGGNPKLAALLAKLSE